jgi:hypothetical protein
VHNQSQDALIFLPGCCAFSFKRKLLTPPQYGTPPGQSLCYPKEPWERASLKETRFIEELQFTCLGLVVAVSPLARLAVAATVCPAAGGTISQSYVHDLELRRCKLPYRQLERIGQAPYPRLLVVSIQAPYWLRVPSNALACLSRGRPGHGQSAAGGDVGR